MYGSIVIGRNGAFACVGRDEAVFIGKDGDREILASDVAKSAGTISNEILSRLGNRLERIANHCADG